MKRLLTFSAVRCLRVAAVAVALILGIAASEPVPRTLPPRDDSSLDPSFADFKAHLLDAARQCDVDTIVASMEPSIVNDEWEDWEVTGWSQLCEQLADALQLGTVRQSESAYCAPYVLCLFPDHLISFSAVVIVGRNVRARAAPSAAAKVLERLSYDILRACLPYVPECVDPQRPPDPLTAPPGWAIVILNSGQPAYVKSEYAREISGGFFVEFGKRSGKWWIDALRGFD